MSAAYSKPSVDGTHHVNAAGCPSYPGRFLKVGKFHTPGLAPVEDSSGAYHITVEGKPAYTHRYLAAWGFYCNRAAVLDAKGWLHINPSGVPTYDARYSWVGNFQEDACAVCDVHGFYHIDLKGEPLYQARHLYAGDFRDGIAAIRSADGLCRHIFVSGERVHPHAYTYLDQFHKGYARAQDLRGWFHVNAQGEPAYSARFAMVEPFYNGLALCQTHQGDYVRINEYGLEVDLKSRRETTPATIILVTGNIGAGKSTLCQRLAERLGWPVLGIDDCRKLAGDGSPAGEAASWHLFLSRIQRGGKLIVEYSGAGPFRPLVERALGPARVVRVRLTTGVQDCLQRIAGRNWAIPYPFALKPDQELLLRIDAELRTQESAKRTLYISPQDDLGDSLNQILVTLTS